MRRRSGRLPPAARMRGGARGAASGGCRRPLRKAPERNRRGKTTLRRPLARPARGAALHRATGRAPATPATLFPWIEVAFPFRPRQGKEKARPALWIEVAFPFRPRGLAGGASAPPACGPSVAAGPMRGRSAEPTRSTAEPRRGLRHPAGARSVRSGLLRASWSSPREPGGRWLRSSPGACTRGPAARRAVGCAVDLVGSRQPRECAVAP